MTSMREREESGMTPRVLAYNLECCVDFYWDEKDGF